MLADPIAALATPPGRSAVAVIRVSGRGAWDVAGRVLTPFHTTPVRVTRRTRAVQPGTGDTLDDALYTVFRAPASYTGEDLVEISTHGGLLVPGEVLAALCSAGARLAEPGEFTRRAVQHGKMDLLQAEAIGDLVDATAPAQRRAALMQLDRGTSMRVGALRDQVLGLEALVSYDLDFPEEDDGPVKPEQVADAIHAVRHDLEALLATAADGTRLREGAICVIAGAPNAGKSSLFNALLGHERAIVTELPGTTRDAIEAPATCGGFPFRLVDTAGLRESDDRLERLGIEVSHRYLAAADVVLVCVDAGRPLADAERHFMGGLGTTALLVRTKADLVDDGARLAEDVGLPVSALTGWGLEAIRQALAELAFAGLVRHGDPEPLLTRERHRIALTRARDQVDAFAEARADGVDGALAATHLRAAVTVLEDVIGLVTPDDVLERVFASFCVGK